jgi:hypothetical protein
MFWGWTELTTLSKGDLQYCTENTLGSSHKYKRTAHTFPAKQINKLYFDRDTAK